MRPEKRRCIIEENVDHTRGYREQQPSLDLENLEAIERKIGQANSRLHELNTQTIRKCNYNEQEFALVRRSIQDLKKINLM